MMIPAQFFQTHRQRRTQNRKPLVSFLTCFFGVSWRSLVVFLVIFVLATLWSYAGPQESVRITRDASFEDLVIDAQIRRSHEIPKVDMIITGDSSTLMGIDIPYLEALLADGRRIEGLATIANVSPKGNLQLVQNYAVRNGPPEMLILQMNPITFADPQRVFDKKYEKWVLDDVEPKPAWYLRGWQKLYRDGIASVLKFPMRNEYARQYGWPSDVFTFLNAHQGSMFDPGPVIPWTSDPHYFTVGLPYLHKFMQARTLLETVQPKKTFFILTPNIESKNSPQTARTRELTYQFLLGILGLDIEDQLDLPATLPDALYVSTHHLNPKGRRAYTELLAHKIKAVNS